MLIHPYLQGYSIDSMLVAMASNAYFSVQISSLIPSPGLERSDWAGNEATNFEVKRRNLGMIYTALLFR